MNSLWSRKLKFALSINSDSLKFVFNIEVCFWKLSARISNSFIVCVSEELSPESKGIWLMSGIIDSSCLESAEALCYMYRLMDFSSKPNLEFNEVWSWLIFFSSTLFEHDFVLYDGVKLIF